jgi:uncharacterized protein (DUF305 family)
MTAFSPDPKKEKQMKSIKALAAAVLVAATPLAASAQDHSAHGGATSFPDVCKSTAQTPPAGHPAADMGMMADHQKEAMEGMVTMDRDMMQGMMKEDPNVAFVCGMIAHHQGAIDMANVELKYGDDQWAKELAQKVIDEQTKEIAEMTDWLKNNVK